MKSWNTFLFEAKIMGQRAIGKKVKLKPNSMFSWYFDDVTQAIGIVLSYDADRSFRYKVRFETVRENMPNELRINYNDFEILTDDYKLPKMKVRWYKYGKLHDEIWEDVEK